MGGDVTSDQLSGIQFTAPDESWNILPGVLVYSPTVSAVRGSQSGAELENAGVIAGTSAGSSGVELQGDNLTIINYATGTIHGQLHGLELHDTNITVSNYGSIVGVESAGLYFRPSADGVLSAFNVGYIFGENAGIAAHKQISGEPGATIVNFGEIDSDQHGIQIISAPGVVTTIINEVGGVINGFAAAIATLSNNGGAIFLTNNGQLLDDIDCDAPNENDKVVNNGQIFGDVNLGSGNDTFVGSTGLLVFTVFGEAGADTLTGGKASDRFNGGDGNDVLTGNRGKDFLTGGLNADRFDFNSIKDSVKGGNRDQILDFKRGQDDIDLRTIDAKSGIAGNQAFKFIGKDKFSDEKGELRYIDKGSTVIVQGDTNGNGNADFEILVNAGALGSGDFLL